ncbi:hypothetical protein Micbo1qcDRAFT_163035 [Microdochium bolleyi]|uniref:Glycosyltransferase family 31 protein n=1 Tax=Microdochium bolleyi TaxID=196109 RepID=A0A136J2L9_9PEZI|nr:hypothetical protein Micbo1qcDRAFT_163035 [Microdochium bolleyi]
MIARAPRVLILVASAFTFLFIYTQFYVGGGPAISRYASTLVRPSDPQQSAAPPANLDDFTIKNHDSAIVGETAVDSTDEPDLAIDSPDKEPAKLAELADDKKGGGKAGGSVAEKPIDKPAQPVHSDGSSIHDGVPKDFRFLIQGATGQELTEKIHYTRKCIKPVFTKDIDRDQILDVGHTLLNGSVEVDLFNTKAATVPDCEQIKLSVPQPYPKASISHIIFGVSTDLVRLGESLPAFEHWLANSGAQLIAVVTDHGKQSQENITKIENKFHTAGINATFVKPVSADLTVSQNHFAVLVDLVAHGDDNTQWFGLIDDDTFMPDLWPFAQALATIDHTEDVYVGQLSEDFQAVRHFGFMAFGGAGAYFSAPLARKLAPKALKCIHEASGGEGDIIIRDCVYSHSKAKLTMLDGIWQQDMKDDVSGFFEAGIKPLVLHHWKSWYREPMAKMALASKFCGDCFLQRFQFEQNTVFTSGYSIVTYPKGMQEVDLDKMEGTWAQAGRDYDFSVGPLRDRLPKDRKKSYKLKHAEITEKGELRQLYVYRTDRVHKDEPEEEEGESADPLAMAQELGSQDHKGSGKKKKPAAGAAGAGPEPITTEKLGRDGTMDEVIELIWTL